MCSQLRRYVLTFFAIALSSIFISFSDFLYGCFVKVEATCSAFKAGAGKVLIAWKKMCCSDWDAVGLCCGS